MDLFPYKSKGDGMEPVAMPGYYVDIQYASERHYGKVDWLEPIPPFQFLNLGAIAAGALNANPTEATNLHLEDNEFGQFRWYPIDHVQVSMYLPSANGKYKLKNLLVPIDEMVIDRDPCLHLTEFFLWEDKAPFFQALNYTDYALTQCRLIGMGFRYKLQVGRDGKYVSLPDDVINSIEAGTTPCVHIQASGKA